MEEKYNVAVIGGGSAGYVAAIRAAQLGGKVAIVEGREFGGTCLNRGCIPTKTLLISGDFLQKARIAGEFGIKAENVGYDLKRIQDRKNAVVKRLVEGVEYLLQKRKVTLIRGRGELTSPNSVGISMDGERKEIKASKIIIATGSEPALIPIFNIDGVNVLTSDDALQLEESPKSILIVGSGAIGAEFACLLNILGTDVTVVEMLPQMLPTEDAEIARRLGTICKRRKVKVLTNDRVEKVEIEGPKRVTTTLSSGKSFTTEKVLVAIGRSLNSTGIGLEELGVKTERGRILVNDHMETNIKGIYATGDVVGGLMLAHVAHHEGIIAAQNCMGKETKADYRAVPSCIFTQPEIASIGLKESEAKEKGYSIKIGRFPFSASGKAVCLGETEGFVKIVADEKTGQVLGTHAIGPHVTDLIAEIAVAMKNGISVEQIADTIHAHPTLSESLLEASMAVDNLSIHSI
jgi:dihydrolipoamide dehydrogenase